MKKFLSLVVAFFMVFSMVVPAYAVPEASTPEEQIVFDAALNTYIPQALSMASSAGIKYNGDYFVRYRPSSSSDPTSYRFAIAFASIGSEYKVSTSLTGCSYSSPNWSGYCYFNLDLDGSLIIDETGIFSGTGFSIAPCDVWGDGSSAYDNFYTTHDVYLKSGSIFFSVL